MILRVGLVLVSRAVVMVLVVPPHLFLPPWGSTGNRERKASVVRLVVLWLLLLLRLARQGLSDGVE